MAEWSIAHPWKGCKRATVSGVRIPLSPQKLTSLEVKEKPDRAVGAGEEDCDKKRCRCATNWKGEEKEKHAVLSRTVGFVPTFLT